MGYPAPPLLTDESRLALFRNWLITPANVLEIGLSSHKGFAIQVIDPPATLSWLPIKLAHGERELLDHCKYNTCIAEIGQANSCSHIYGAFDIGYFRTRQERLLRSFGALSSFRQFTSLHGCAAICIGSLVVPPQWSESRCLPAQSSRSPYTNHILRSLHRRSPDSSAHCCQYDTVSS